MHINGADRNTISRVNNSQGHIMETMIMGAARQYEQQGRLMIHKESEPFHMVKYLNRGRGRAEVQFTAKAQPDFIGCLKGGRLIAIEAKYTRSDRIKQDAVTETQAGALLRYCRMGAAAFICCGIGTGFDLAYFMVPWDVWGAMQDIWGHKYATAKELADYEVQADMVIHFMDYIEPGGKVEDKILHAT